MGLPWLSTSKKSKAPFLVFSKSLPHASTSCCVIFTWFSSRILAEPSSLSKNRHPASGSSWLIFILAWASFFNAMGFDGVSGLMADRLAKLVASIMAYWKYRITLYFTAYVKSSEKLFVLCYWTFSFRRFRPNRVNDLCDTPNSGSLHLNPWFPISTNVWVRCTRAASILGSLSNSPI